MKLSISLKLLIGLSALIFGMTGSITYFNSEYLKKTILQREKDFNLSITEAKAKEIDAYIDKQTTSFIFLTKQLLLNPDSSEIFKNNPDLLSIQVVSAINYQSHFNFIKPDWNFNQNQILTENRENYKKALLKQIENSKNRIITINSSTLYPPPSGQTVQPVLTLVIPYSNLDGKLNQVIFANISTRYIQKLFSDTKVGTMKLFNDWGYSIAGSTEKYITSTENISKSEIFGFMKNYPLPNYSGLYSSSSSDEGDLMLSFAKTPHGLYVVSEIPTTVLLAPAQLIVLMTLRLSGYFLAGSLFLLFLFSLKMTQPLEKLSEISLEIAKGNFEHKPTELMKQFFKDEVYTLSVAVDRMVKGLQERNRFKTLFDKFHGSAVTENLMKNEVALRGEKKNVFVFFSDLRGFTGMSESKDPQEVVEMLNEYFSYMVPVINQYGGVVDKFIGDAIMAVWGVPNSSVDDGKHALMACLKMRLALEQLNQVRIERGESPLMIGMGLHFGEAISGTIGSEQRMEYTVIGNTINTASRIEASTKAFGTDLLVSAEVIEQLDGFLYREAGSVEVKGRSEPLKLYKVHGYLNEHGVEMEIKTAYSDYEAESADKVKIVA